jgi:hypothetical protein
MRLRLPETWSDADDNRLLMTGGRYCELYRMAWDMTVHPNVLLGRWLRIRP